MRALPGAGPRALTGTTHPTGPSTGHGPSSGHGGGVGFGSDVLAAVGEIGDALARGIYRLITAPGRFRTHDDPPPSRYRPPWDTFDPFAGYPGEAYWPGDDGYPDPAPTLRVTVTDRHPAPDPAQRLDAVRARQIAAAQLAARRALAHPGYTSGRPGGAPLHLTPAQAEVIAVRAIGGRALTAEGHT